MRIHLLLLSLALWSAAPAFCQKSRIDSLTRLAESQTGLQRIKTLNDLAASLLPDDPAASLAKAEEAIVQAQQLGDHEGLAKAFDNAGLALLQKLDHKRAMSQFLEALKIRDNRNDAAGQAQSRYYMGRVFFLMEDYVQAEESLKKSLETWEKVGNPKGAAQVHEMLGNVFMAKEIYGRSLEHYRQSLELKLTQKDLPGAAELASRIGEVSAELGDHESAITYYRTALELNRELGKQPAVAMAWSRIALSEMERGSLEEALEANQQALGIRTALSDAVGLAESEKNAGLILLELGDKAKAQQHFTAAINYLKDKATTAEMPSIYEQVSAGFAKAGLPDRAYSAHVQFAKVRDEVLNKEKSEALLDLTTKYEAEFAAREQQQKIELLQLENAANRKLRSFLFAVIGLIGLLLTSVYLSYRRKLADNFLLSQKNEEIQRQHAAITSINRELEQKNNTLDLLNKRLVDEMSERETIEKSSFARDRFLATMSHEMRTPLNIITGLTHLLLESGPRPDQVEQLRTLQYSANDLVVFINDVLDFSKIEVGKLDLEDREFFIGPAIQEVTGKFEKMAEEKGLLFHLSYDQDIPVKLLGDNARLHQVLNNLMQNALNHTEEGMLRMDVSLQNLDTREALLKFTIEGTDGGVERKILDSVAKPWQEEGDDDHEAKDSELLSLAITKRLVELQHGKMDVIYRSGESTQFVVLMPFKVLIELKKAAAEKTGGPLNLLAGSRILVVEDNKINQLVVAKMLRKHGVEVITADNGLEALEVFEYEDFDLILMDIQMPEMDGYRATAEIRRHPISAKRDVPIIALTASAFLTEKDKAVLFGMNDHVGKPFSPEELLGKINACLKVYREV